MQDYLILFLLFAAIAIGFALGRLSAKRKEKGSGGVTFFASQPHAIKSIAHLLTEESDTAIETFIDGLEVSSNTIETHLALGNLLRKRGEIARAIRVHQNLIARPSLSRQEQEVAQYELAVDFIAAGLLDRAEGLLRELVDTKTVGKVTRAQCLERLTEIYVDMAEWLKAIDTADRLTSSKFGSTPDQWREMQAYLSCELAQEAAERKDWMSARRCLRDALRYDKHCVRASLLQADLDMGDDAYVSALATLRKIPYETPELTSEVLEPMMKCFKALNSHEEMVKELESIYEKNGDLVTLATLSQSIDDDEKVIQLLLQELPKFIQFSNLRQLLSLLNNSNIQVPTSLKSALFALLEQMDGYHCKFCGFEGSHMHWLCPKCKTWGSIVHL